MRALDHNFRSLVGLAVDVFDDGMEIHVATVEDHEAEPLGGEVPVSHLVILGHFISLCKAGVRVDGGCVVVPEGDDFDDADNQETDGVDVSHDTAPGNEEPDEAVVVGAGKDPYNSGRDILDEESDDVDVLGDSPHAVGVPVPLG